MGAGPALGRWLKDAGTTPTAFVRGDMRRHRETLEAMAEAAGWGLDDVRVDADWDEFDHVGLVAGLPGRCRPASSTGARSSRSSSRRRRPGSPATTRWKAAGARPTPAFVDRVGGALRRTTALAGAGQTVVVVTSGGTVAITAALLVGGLDQPPTAVGALWQRFNTVIANSSVTRLVVGSTGARLLTFNEHPHLPGRPPHLPLSRVGVIV